MRGHKFQLVRVFGKAWLRRVSRQEKVLSRMEKIQGTPWLPCLVTVAWVIVCRVAQAVM